MYEFMRPQEVGKTDGRRAMLRVATECRSPESEADLFCRELRGGCEAKTGRLSGVEVVTNA